jgi:hypothetical protein
MINTSKPDALDIILLVGSILALGFCILVAGSMAIIAGLNNFLQLLENAQAAWTVSVIFGAMGILTLPGLYLSYRSINGQPALIGKSISAAPFIVGLGFPLAIALGFYSRELNLLPFFIEPFAHVIAAVTPMLFMALYVIRRLPRIPWRRFWGQFTAGLWVSPFIALIVELLAALPLLIVLFAYIWTEVDPREFIEPLTSSDPLNDFYLDAQIEAALNQPLLIISAILFVTVIVPILEEFIKTIAMWPMLRRGFPALYAFVGGTIAGGAYGLFEAFFLAQPGEDWAALMIARAGATFMHMITTGMASLGLAIGLKDRNWGTVLRYYGFAVLLHGLWNLAAIGVGLGYLAQEAETSLFVENGITAIVIASGVVLTLLTAGAVFGLHSFPKYLLKKQQVQTSQEASAGVS